MEPRRPHWNAIHLAAAASEKEAIEALTGSNAPTTLAQHSISPQTGMVVLDVGVGLGNMARYLAELGCTVDCLDVADAAEQAVREWMRRFYIADEIVMLPTAEYELAISHLTAQHMTDSDLRRQIREVGRALRPGGIFSLQLEGGYVPEMENYRGSKIPDGFDGAMCRTPEYAQEMIADELGHGCEATITPTRFTFPALPPESYEHRHGRQFDCYWYFAHIRRR